LGGNSDPIDIARMLKTLEDSDLTYKIVFAGGGEPMLIPNLVDALVALSRTHYVALHSNLTLMQAVGELAERVDPRRVLYLMASLHADELDRTGLTERFLDGVALLRRKGFPVSVHAVAHPDFLPSVPDWQASLQAKGIELKLDPFLGMHDGRIYPDAYTAAERRDLGFGDLSIFRTKGKACNAGFNVGLVLANGDVRFCSEVDTKIGNIYEGIEFRDEATVCPSESCRCPFYAHDRELFRAMSDRASEAQSLPAAPTVSVSTDDERAGRNR
jgi:MoaA/NifB/PqqE/SkfB family radical SAM enzyme